MTRIERSPRAKADILIAARYMAQQSRSRATANRWIDTISAPCERQPQFRRSTGPCHAAWLKRKPSHNGYSGKGWFCDKSEKPRPSNGLMRQ